MSIKTLLSESGKLDISAISFDMGSDETISVLSVLSAHGVNQSKLLDQLFGTSFSSTAPTLGIAASFVEGDDAAVMTEPCHHIVALDVEPYDGPHRERDESRERAAHLSVSLSDVIMFVARMSDLHRSTSNGVSSLRSSLTEMLLLEADSIVSSPNGKRAFLVVVRDHEAEVLSRQGIVTGFLHELQEMYNSIAKPPGSPARINDLFEIEFILLPNEHLQPDEYKSAIADLQAYLLDPVSDNFLFGGGLYLCPNPSQLGAVAGKAWMKLEEEQIQDMPDDGELMSTFDCDNAMRRVFQKYQKSVRAWRRETEGRVILEKFGERASDMVEQTVAVYEKDAAAHKRSKAFKRKREELKDLLDADLYGLFVTQVARLREVTYRLFKDKLGAIGEGETRLDKAVNATLKESQKYFQVNAEALRPKSSSWRYDNDMKELAAQMREDATERLQRARLADYQSGASRRNRRFRSRDVGSGNKRQPIQLSFHYLDPAPFGWKDSRYDKLTTDDNMQFEKSVQSNADGQQLSLAPSRGSSWYRKNQDFIYTERK
eukprot:GFKZ01002692.1.p2 GENE.GFKZ01002692.1~~GFKZ01002692.1.p2  ORF type:complete len:579 (+),score=78.56 GFKZ01002692.1:105-1739(+)